MVAEGVHDVALRAEAAARRSGQPAALADGAAVLASLSSATGDLRVIADLHHRSLALAEASLRQARTRARTHLVTGTVLAASVFHDGDLTVGQIKTYVSEQGLAVRP